MGVQRTFFTLIFSTRRDKEQTLADKMAGVSWSAMCNLYSITSSQDAMCRLFEVTDDLAANQPLMPAVPALLVTADERDTWLRAPWSKAAALQGPLADQMMPIVTTGRSRTVPSSRKAFKHLRQRSRPFQAVALTPM